MTTIDNNFLKNKLDYVNRTPNEIEGTGFYYVYRKMCRYINKMFFMHPTPEQIEKYIETGVIRSGGDTKTCKLSTRKEREECFKMAQALQFISDNEDNLRSLTKEFNESNNICQEAHEEIVLLGLFQRTLTTI